MGKPKVPFTTDGWYWPYASVKAHYYRGGKSLCGRSREPTSSGDEWPPSKDHCMECTRKHNRELAATP